MLLISYENTLIQALLQERFSPEYPIHIANLPTASSDKDRATPTSINQVVSDFDGVTYHISAPPLASESSEREGATKSQIQVSISVKCFSELVQYGAQDVLQREYGPYIVEPEAGYDFSVVVELDSLPTEQGALDS